MFRRSVVCFTVRKSGGHAPTAGADCAMACGLHLGCYQKLRRALLGILAVGD
jgi:hypothetical protein